MPLTKLEQKVKSFIDNGIYDQNVIFNTMYPSYFGHYSTLRDTIARVKNR